MDPNALISPVNDLGYPAPFWFLIFFRVLGFTLHMVPMNLWYAGGITAMCLSLSRNAQARRFSARLMAQMPFVIAFGVNLGIVPLLFLQVMSYRVFYSATILLAWQWLSVIALLTLAYYGVYIYAVGLKHGPPEQMPKWQRACGWLSSLLFMAIAVIFHSAMSTMEHVAHWPQLAEQTGRAAAVLGTGHSLADPQMWTRLLMFFGLALTTTAAWIAFDGAMLAGREDPQYRGWTRAFAGPLYLAGLAVYIAGGLAYGSGWDSGLRAYMTSGSALPFAALAAVGPAIPLALLWMLRGNPRGGLFAMLAQFLVLALHAIARQLAQDFRLAPYVDIAADPVKMQVGPLVMFLVSFVAGLALLGWIIAKVVEANRKADVRHQTSDV